MAAAPQWTPQQHAAIETQDVSIALAAGAGCGKTFVLTQRFLAELDRGRGAHGLSGLVAITFTDRAAREMRERIRAGCHHRLQTCADAEVPRWLQFTREIDAARVSTIHSFCGSVLRSAAVEIGLDPQFGLLEPAIARVFLEGAVAETVHRLLETKDPDAHALVLEFGLEKTRRKVEQLVPQRFQMSPAEWTEVTPAELATRWTSLFQQQGRPAILHELGRDPLIPKILRLLRTYEPTNPVMQSRCGMLLAELSALQVESATLNDPTATLQTLCEQATVQGGGGAKAWPDPEIYEAVKKNFEKLRKLASNTQAQLGFNETDLERAAQISHHAVRVAAAALDGYELRKREAGVLDFDDLLLKTGELLRTNAAVRRRIAAGIDFLMVDEFQDTDPIQAEIVRLLCGDRLTTGKLFLVGDAQQSIYRFRRADPTVFRQLRLEIPPAGRLPLNHNFRSQPAILNFANSLFAGALGEAFQELVPHAAQLSPEPAIEFLWATAPAGEEITDTADTRRQREAAWLARRLRDLLADPTPRIREKTATTGEISLRPVRAGDIVILFRALSDVSIYERAFHDCQLDYYLVKGKAFYAQQEVYDLLNLLRALGDPTDQVSLLGALRSPLFGLSDDTLFALRQQGYTLRAGLETPLPAAFDEAQRQLAHRAHIILVDLWESKERLSLTELLQRIFDDTGYDASLLVEFLGRRKLANLRKLLEQARQFDRAGGLSLTDFVSQLQTAVVDETAEEMAATQAEASDVIRMMTIHQSKGLEFPVVVIADMDRSGEPPPTGTEFDAELGPLVQPEKKFGYRPEHLGLRLHALREDAAEAQEKLRLLYVAVTRAADHLILSSSLKDILAPGSGWLQLLAERYDLQTGLPVQTAIGEAVIPAPFDQKCPGIEVHLVSPRSPLTIPEEQLRLALEDFRESVAQAAPAPLPDLLRPLPVDLSTRREWSVSVLEDLEHSQADSAQTVNATSKKSKPAADEVGIDRTELGHLVHAVLEQIHWQGDLTQVPRLLQANWTATLRPLPDDLIQAATRRVAALWNSPQGAELRQATRCYREIDFHLPVLIPGQAAPHYIAGQIDCVYETTTGQWVILDYKTGTWITEETGWRAYELQLGIYAWAWQEYSGVLPQRVEVLALQTPVRASVWPVSPEKLQEIKDRVQRLLQPL